MVTWIALFRGINVGGNIILPMAKLKNVRTYIQSENAISDSSAKTLHFFFLAAPAGPH
jgi:uncharacterized protein (DUF1697 family)